jgi:hypothetical protein
MATRTIEPIQVVLPISEDGFYRFSDLPRLIADVMFPENPDVDDAEREFQWMKHAFKGVEAFRNDLTRAAELPDGEPGYLHVVEDSAVKRPLEWRTGAVLDAGLVHLDWLNEWGESRRPPLVFSTESAPKPQGVTPAPVAAARAVDGEAWKVKARQRANEIIKRQKANDFYPSQEDIADEIAREFRADGVAGAGGKPLTGAYIKRHALKGISSAQNRQLSTSIPRGK